MRRNLGFCRCVLMGGVHITLEGKEHLDLIDDIFCRIVHIQRQARPGKDTVLLPSAALLMCQGRKPPTSLISSCFAFPSFRYCSTVSAVRRVWEIRARNSDSSISTRVPVLLHSGVSNTQSDHSVPSSIKISMFLPILRSILSHSRMQRCSSRFSEGSSVFFSRF